MTLVVSLKRPLFWGLFCLALLSGCIKGEVQPVALSGETMGAGYHVKYLPVEGAPEPGEVQRLIELLLSSLDSKMSTYKEGTELAEFNRQTSTKPFAVSPETLEALSEAIWIGKRSGGALDVTVLPLVELWGFGKNKGQDTSTLPTSEQIKAAQAKLGLDQLVLDPKGLTLTKKNPALQIDFSAIAPGFAADQIAELLDLFELKNHMVEVGGEVRAEGTRGNGEPWRIGIEQPLAEAGKIELVVELKNQSLATSGDYRNYYEKDGKRYSHTLDPKTGRPIDHKLASVSVVTPSCMSADGWATALNVLGEEQGFALAQKEGLAAFFIYRDGEGFKTKATPAFLALQKGPQPKP